MFDPSKYHLSDLIKVALMVTEILMLEDDNFSVAGEVGSLCRHSAQDRIIRVVSRPSYFYIRECTWNVYFEGKNNIRRWSTRPYTFHWR